MRHSQYTFVNSNTLNQFQLFLELHFTIWLNTQSKAYTSRCSFKYFWFFIILYQHFLSQISTILKEFSVLNYPYLHPSLSVKSTQFSSSKNLQWFWSQEGKAGIDWSKSKTSSLETKSRFSYLSAWSRTAKSSECQNARINVTLQTTPFWTSHLPV